jgi:pimeloyl-ACP methyl ester carboxylesterase
MAPSDTTVIFVPGAWHSPSCFSIVCNKLKASGYSINYITLPSVGPSEHLSDFRPDVEKIRTAILKAADAGRKVVLVVHSYGSLPANEAIRDLDISSRAKNGLGGGVSHLFFCCSFVIPEGQSLISAFGGADLPWFSISADKMEVQPATPAETFYNDLAEDEVEMYVKGLRPHSYRTFHSKCTFAAWKVVPSTYLYCLRDQAIPIVIQKLMVEGTAGGAGVVMRTEAVDAGHSPFISKPEEVVAAIRRAAEL